MSGLGGLLSLFALGSAPDAYQTAAKKRLDMDDQAREGLALAAMENAAKMAAPSPQPQMAMPQMGGPPPGPQPHPPMPGAPPPQPPMGGPSGPGGAPPPQFPPPGGPPQGIPPWAARGLPGAPPVPPMGQQPQLMGAGQPQMGGGPMARPPMPPGPPGGAPPGAGPGPPGSGGMPQVPPGMYPAIRQQGGQQGQPQENPAIQQARQQGANIPPGGFDWRQLLRQIMDANPDMKPGVAAAAMNKLLPFMQMQSKTEWLQAHNQFLEQQLAIKTATQERGQDIGLEKTRETQAAADARTAANIAARKEQGDAARALRKDISEASIALRKQSTDLKDPEIRADTSSLTNLQKNMDGVDTYSKYTERNGEKLLELAGKIDGTGVPAIDRWVRAGRREVAGDADVNNFDFQLRSFKNEVARILTNANITGQLTNQARSEADEFLSRGVSLSQLEGVFDTFKTDVDNRTSELAAGVSDIKERIAARRAQLAGTPAGAAPAASPTKGASGQSEAKPAAASSDTTKTIGGKTYVKKDGKWYEQ